MAPGELYIAYNFNGVKVRRYEKSGQPPITAEVYDMGTSEDAFGVFSFERQDEEAGIGQGSEFGGGLLRFWKGKFFVSVFAEGQGKEAEAATLELGKVIAKSIDATGADSETARGPSEREKRAARKEYPLLSQPYPFESAVLYRQPEYPQPKSQNRGGPRAVRAGPAENSSPDHPLP